MGLSVKQGVVLSPSGTGSQATTGVGFQPKVVIFLPSKLTADGFGTDMRYGVGWGISSSARRAMSMGHNFNVAQMGGRQNATTCLTLGGNTGSVELEADLTSLDADGFTLNWTTVVNTAKVPYLALGGSDLTNVGTGTFALNTSTGNQAVTGVGFQPDAVIFLASQNTAIPAAASGAAFFTIGAASSTSARGSLSFADANASPSQVAQAELTNKCLVSTNSSATILYAADLVSFDSDGFTINLSTAPGSAYQVFYLALKGARFKVGSETQKTSTGTKATTGVGFQPAGLLMFSANAVASGSGDNTVARATIGMTDGTNRALVWGQTVDNSATPVAQSAITTSRMIGSYTTTSTVVAEGDISSLDSDGFTTNWTSADGTAREFVYLAVGAAAAAATSVPSGLSLLSVGS